MFKPLIKKVREGSNNSSILPDNNSEETNGHLIKENNNTDDENSLSSRARSSSNTQSSSVDKSRYSSTSNESEKKEDSIKSLSDIFSPYTKEPININNYVEIIQSWMDSKEEILRQKDETIQSLLEETNKLNDEMINLKSKLVDIQNCKEKNPIKSPYLQKQTDTLRIENDNLKSTIKSLRAQLNDVEAERDDLLIKSTDVSTMKSNDDLRKQLEKEKTLNHQQKVELESLRQALVERDIIIEQQDKRLLVDHETIAIQTDEDKSFVQVLAEPDVDTISKLQAELDDKNRTIKVLQQRYNDLRKTLQREFHASIPKDLNQMGSSKTTNNTSSSPTNLPLIHYDGLATSQSDVDAAKRSSTVRQMTAVRKHVTFPTETTSTSPAILPHTSIETTSSKVQKNGHHSSIIDGQTTVNGTNFKYLKHVLLKFMTSTEDEAIHLIRAVSTLLNLSVDEERLLRETLDYKMSWFGKVTRLKPLPSNSNF